MSKMTHQQRVLEGRTALVTGATRGIGRGIADAMAEAGAHVILLGRDAATAEAAAAEIAAAGGKASGIAADLADDAVVETLIPRLLEAHGALDILVNNAGVDDEREALTYPLDVWRNIIRVNLETPFRLAQAIAPHFIGRQSGVIINIASIFGVVGGADECAYASAKHGLVGLTKVLAIEWAAKGIRVNAIAPGLVQTDMTKYLWTDETILSHVERRIPCGRIGQPREIGGAAVFLASDAASFIHGETLVVDGGFVVS